MSNPNIIANVITKFTNGNYHMSVVEVELLDINLNTKSVKVRYKADLFGNGMATRTDVIGFGNVNSRISIAVDGCDVVIVNPLTVFDSED